jgi:predicted nucleic acid-binding protein
VIVLDASAAIELILNTETGRSIASRISDPEIGIHAPHLIDVEVMQTLRRYVKEGEIDSRTVKSVLDDFRSLDIERHAHEPLLDRVWALRENLTAYDAVYVALAEALDAMLITCDGKMARSPGIRKHIEYFGNY